MPLWVHIESDCNLCNRFVIFYPSSIFVSGIKKDTQGYNAQNVSNLCTIY